MTKKRSDLRVPARRKFLSVTGQSVRRTEWALAILLTARVSHAGPLWRDECGSVQLAQMPSFTDIFENFSREAFPVPFPALLRGYMSMFGTSDTALRGFGFAVGFILLLVIWINSRLLAAGPPLLLLALLGLNATFLTWGTSIRAYGMGSVLILFAFGLIAKMLCEPTWSRFLAALFVSLASVQVLLYNCVLLAALGVAVVTVSAVRRQLRPALAMAGIGLLCAASMLPYVGPYSRGTQWNMLQKGPLTLSLIWKQLLLAFGDSWHVMTWVWPVLFVVTITGVVRHIYLTRARKAFPEWDLLLFGVTASIAAIVGYYAFLKALSYGTRPWYYLALLSFLAGALDLFVTILSRIKWIRMARLTFVSAALLALPAADWPAVTQRQTNIDLIAQKLEKIARPNDLIVVNPWWLGLSFNWYYRGTANWVTLPTMSDHRVHRFDLVKEKMMSPNPIGDLRQMIARTLQSNNRVWFVGNLHFLEPGESPPGLPGPADTDFRWNSDIYLEVWSAQLATFVQAHLLRVANVAVEPAGMQVEPLEDVPLFGVEGWKE